MFIKDYFSFCNRFYLCLKRLVYFSLPLLLPLPSSISHTLQAQIAPFLPTVTVYIVSGMTHLDEDIRMRCLAILNVWMENFPLLLARYARQLLPNYVQLLSVDTFTKSSVLSTSATFNATQSPNTPSSTSSPSSSSTKSGPPKKSRRAQFVSSAMNSLNHYLTIISSSSSNSSYNTTQEGRSSSPSHSEQLWVEGQHTHTLFIPSPFEGTGRNVASSFSHQDDSQQRLLTTPELTKFITDIFPSLLQHWLEGTPSVEIQPASDTDFLVLVINTIATLLDTLFTRNPSSASFPQSKAQKRTLRYVDNSIGRLAYVVSCFWLLSLILIPYHYSSTYH
jgi:hypothetical protein